MDYLCKRGQSNYAGYLPKTKTNKLMKFVPLTEEQYTALLSLGVIKEEQIPLFEVRDDGRIKTIIKELQPWEKYPTLESCWKTDGTEIAYNISFYGNIKRERVYSDYYHYSTEAEAKKARATIFLSRIARKWNEGVEIYKDKVWFISMNKRKMYVDYWISSEIIDNLLPFNFHSKELAEKSKELFPDVWNDFYGRQQ